MSQTTPRANQFSSGPRTIQSAPFRRLAWNLAGLLVLSAAQACFPAVGTPPSATVTAVAVSIKDFAFSPQTLTVPSGTTVTWTNLDDEPHSVRGADAQIRSDALDQHESYSVRFEKPGTYKYGCSLHPKMSGTIVVQ